MDYSLFFKQTLTGAVIPPKINPFPFSVKSGDGNVLPFVATVKDAPSHSNNPNVPITLCVGHSNQFVCALCDKFCGK